ncbi:phenylacetyl-CoA ligase [Amylostereum chailletii]|nr:phenylacetyl-CoA ligase [Amylostereum chailletii]
MASTQSSGEIYPTGPCFPLDIIPDDLTMPQFLLDTHHAYRPTRPSGAPCLIERESGKGWGLAEIRTRVYGLANALSFKYGIADGDVVCLVSPNHMDYGTAIWAAQRLGAAVTLCNPAFTASEIEYELTATNAKFLIAHSDSMPAATAAAALSGIPPDRIVSLDSCASYVAVEDLVQEGLRGEKRFEEVRLAKGGARTKVAFYCFSSGTTGKPKAVAIQHYAPIANIVQISVANRIHEAYAPGERRRFNPGDVHLVVIPLFHMYGLIWSLHWSLFAGMASVIVPKFDFVRMLKDIARYRVHNVALVPPQIVALCKSPETRKHDLSSLRALVFGAAPVSAELTDQLIRLFPEAEMGQGYGMTELSMLALMFPLTQKIGVPGSAGQLLPGCVAKILKPDGTPAKTGEPGELVLWSPSAALGYHNNPQATKETFVDGWVRTGDEVSVDAEGNFYVVDRIKELIKVRGFQVAPAELEGFLLTHPAVADACVVGLPDDYSGEVPRAFIVLKPEAAARVRVESGEEKRLMAGIAKFVADGKVAYRRLAGGVEFVDEIPKTPSGKILRRHLRDAARAQMKAENARGVLKARL